MSEITFDVSGVEALARRLEATRAALRQALGVGAKAVGENIRTNSMGRVPVDLGVLRASHYVTDPEEVSPGVIGVVVGCGGGPAKPYAIVQHERLDLRHAEGEAKFLENAARDEGRQAQEIMGRYASAALRKAAGGGGGS